MTITDSQRHRLHNKLDEVLGEEDAAVLISHLPPSGWSDVARTRDLEELERRIDARFAVVGARFDAVDARFDALESRLDARFEVVDLRFETMESRFEARIERSMREQTSRFLLAGGGLLTVFATIQTIVTAAIAG